MNTSVCVTIFCREESTPDINEILSGIIIGDLKPQQLRFTETVEGKECWELVWGAENGSEKKQDLIVVEPPSVRMGNSWKGRWIKYTFGLSDSRTN